MNSATPKEARRAVAQLTVLRILVYAILVFLSILCLFSFVMLFINASRSNGPAGTCWKTSETPGRTAPSIFPAAFSTALSSPPAPPF